MTKAQLRCDAKDRRDHYVPQGYLRGFVHPTRESLVRPLWVLDTRAREWSERSASQIGWERGFYDYELLGEPDATGDDAFRRLENDLPRLRRVIRETSYESWTAHRNTLVAFAAMMAARSPLFRTQAISQVLPSLAGEPNRASLAKNYSITLMRGEIQRRATDWQAYHWVLAYTLNPEHPFVAGDQGVGMVGAALTLPEAFERNDFWLWCPLSWDTCLIASSQPLTARPTAELGRDHIAKIRDLTRRQAMRFIASPVPLPTLT